MIQLGARTAFHASRIRPMLRYGVPFDQCIAVDMPCEPERVRRWVSHNPGTIVKPYIIQV